MTLSFSPILPHVAVVVYNRRKWVVHIIIVETVGTRGRVGAGFGSKDAAIVIIRHGRRNNRPEDG
jgi:hypothetical protein